MDRRLIDSPVFYILLELAVALLLLITGFVIAEFLSTKSVIEKILISISFLYLVVTAIAIIMAIEVTTLPKRD